MSRLGEALHTARIAAGLTQAQLADRSEVTQAALSRYENGLREPDPATLDRLTSAVGVNTRLLNNMSEVIGSIATEAHMRRRATAPVRVWRRQEASINVLRAQMGLLLSVIDYHPPNTVPILDPIEYPPHEAARLVRAQWRMPQGPVRNLTAWMESAGCLIVERDFGSPRVDGLSQWIGDHPIIMINSRVPTDRKRLTLAHELGHIVMHSEPVHLSAQSEEEAMRFAAEFLMPAHLIRPELRQRSLGHFANMKRKWMVSMAALIERAHNLGTITQTNRTSLYKALSARGWRKKEPLSDQLPPETPTVPASIAKALGDLAYNPQQVATLGGFADVDRAAQVLPLPLPGLRIVKNSGIGRT